eukprot:g33772.t1
MACGMADQRVRGVPARRRVTMALGRGLQVQTPTDGLAQLFSLEADAATPEQRSRAARAAALLFSLAERALLTAERVEELEKAQHTAVEAWHLFMADGDFHSAAWSARTVIHALRARSCACGGTGARFAAAAVALAEEELRRARLSGDDFGEACFLMSMAELHCDAKNLDEGLRCAEAASAAFLRCGAIPATAAAGRVLVVLVLGELQDGRKGRGSSRGNRRSAAAGSLDVFVGLQQPQLGRPLPRCGRSRGRSAAAVGADGIVVGSGEVEQMELRASGWAQCALSLQTQALLAETSHDAAKDEKTRALRRSAFFWSMFLAPKRGFLSLQSVLNAGSTVVAKEALRQHMRTARGPGPRVLLRDAWVQCLKRLDGPGDREKAHAISDKTLATLQIASIHVKSNSWKKVEEACKWAEQAKQKLHGSGDKYLEADAIPSIAKCYILLGRPSDAASVLSERRQLFRELGARRSGKPGDRLGLEKTKRSSSDRTGPRNRRIFQGTIVSIGNMGLDLEPLAVPCAYLTLTG